MSVYLLAPRHHSQCLCTSRRCGTCLNGIRPGDRTTRRSGRCAWRTTGLGTRFVGHYGWTHRKVVVWLPTMRLLFKAKATSFQVCQNASAIPSIGGKNAMILPVVTATAAKCVVVPMQQCGVTRQHTPGGYHAKSFNGRRFATSMVQKVICQLQCHTLRLVELCAGMMKIWCNS